MAKQNKIDITYNDSYKRKKRIGSSSKSNKKILDSGNKVEKFKFNEIDVVFKKSGSEISLTDLVTKIVNPVNELLVANLSYDFDDDTANTEQKNTLDNLQAQMTVQQNHLLQALYAKIKADNKLNPSDITENYVKNLPEYKMIADHAERIDSVNQVVQPIHDSITKLLGNSELNGHEKNAVTKLSKLVQSQKVLLIIQLAEKDPNDITDDYLAKLDSYKVLKQTEDLVDIFTSKNKENAQERASVCIENMNASIDSAAQKYGKPLWKFAKKAMRAFTKIAIHAAAGATVGAGVGGAAAATIAVANFWNGGTFSAPAWPILIGSSAALGALGGTVKAIRDMAANGVPENKKELGDEFVSVVDDTGGKIAGVAKGLVGNIAGGFFEKADEKVKEAEKKVGDKIDDALKGVDGAEEVKNAMNNI